MGNPLRVLIDATGFVPGKALGAEVYLEGVLGGLSRRGDVAATVLCGAAGAERLAAAGPGLILDARDGVPHSPWMRVPWSWRALPAAARRASAQVVFFPLNLVAPSGGLPYVVMIHDLVNRFYRNHLPGHAPLTHAVKARLVARGIRGATRIVTPSQAVADEVMELAPRARGRTFAIHEATDARFVLAPGGASPVPRRMPRERLVLVPSFSGPHKNSERLVAALGELRGRRPELAASLRVIFTGGRNPDFARVEALAARLGVGDLIHQAGYLTRQQLADLYHDVDLVLYPSLYEGFGLPVVEAIHAGVPMLLSDIPVLREVSGGHARFFDPLSARALAEGLADALTSAPVRPLAPPHRGWDTYADELVHHLREACR